MLNYKNKPVLTSHELINKMKIEKGITFNIINEIDAESYLFNINNYLRTASYRKNYQKYQLGDNKGKYINLDFAYLKELSTIDMHLRMLISKMCLDIEHDIKIKILQEVEKQESIDGYQIVKDFISSKKNILRRLESMISSPFTSDLLIKYFRFDDVYDKKKKKTIKEITDYSDCPIWVFLELITFGDLINFSTFFYKQINKKPIVPENILNLVRSLRNGCAHNNCILANLAAGNSKIPSEISQFVTTNQNISKTQRQKKLTCRPMLEFVGLLYTYKNMVSKNIAKKRIPELRKLFFYRMLRNKIYFINNELIRTNYEFAFYMIRFYLIDKSVNCN